MIHVGDVFGHVIKDLKYERHSFFNTNDGVGIEFEFENVNLEMRKKIERFNVYWKQVPEDSIRNKGVEFATTAELWGVDLFDALERMREFIEFSNKYGYVEATSRTSVHVHVDVRSLSVEQLRNFILVATAVEPLLFKISGNRRKHVYCLPYYDSHNGSKLLEKISKLDERSLKKTSTEKYASINLKPIASQGSIEFRHHEGTTDIDRVARWVKCLINIKRYARTMESVIHDFPSFVSEMGFIEFIQSVFQDQANLFTYQGFHLDLLEGVRAAQEGMFQDKLRRADKNLKRKGSGKLMRNFIVSNEDKFIFKGGNK